ncbi:Protein N-acetyltransferase, RimJ/RimL family [Halovenus aranensis]|uniref:Protein N-acetyltransferase, RimJ/RimL family n=1 Tax=Halovenus aranensis TaxID=890420 RepID=A0A1G8TFC6_9EURY|nr:GNAT family protein [Halovenus aranensis]SDJ40292.1 Protein N-acetyltransferase, RimJ/RimL family [Halovenus aranensis]
MPGPVFLDGEGVTLRPLERDDLSFVQTYYNHPDVRQPLGRTEPKTAGDLEDDFEGYMQESVNLLICADDEPVGAVALFDWDETAGRVEIGYWVVPDEQGNGYGSDAVSQALTYAFEERRCHKVVAGVFATNEASQGLLETLGFEQEGRFRDQIFVNGEYVDAIRYGLLAEEWRA